MPLHKPTKTGITKEQLKTVEDRVKNVEECVGDFFDEKEWMKKISDLRKEIPKEVTIYQGKNLQIIIICTVISTIIHVLL